MIDMQATREIMAATDVDLKGQANDLQQSMSARGVVLDGQVDDLQECGSLNVRTNSSNFPRSSIPVAFGRKHAPPPTPPSPPPGTRKLPTSSNAGIGCASKTGRTLCVPKEHVNTLDTLFFEGYKADVAIHTEDGGIIAVHSTILSATSPILRRVLEDTVSRPCSIPMNGVPYHAAKVFLRFLYSSRYEEEEMEQFVVHLLVLSHAYCVPSLKRLCGLHLEQGMLHNENVVDILQIARLCDAPRLHLLCYRVVLNSFKEVAQTDGWRVMRDSNPELEQELVEAVIESDYRKREKVQKMEDHRVYEQLHDAMLALVHICRDGCRTIGPHDKVLNPQNQACNYPACKGLESLVRHFAGCKIKVSGGCIHCKRMWQLLELHSQMCQEEALCKVPLCGHFRTKIRQHQNKRYETRWRLLVKRVVSAKKATVAFSLSAAVSAKLDSVA